MKQLFTKEVVNQKRQQYNRELTAKNEKLVASLKKILALQKEIDFDAAKAKQVKDFMAFCEDIQSKQSKVLAELKAYEKLLEGKKETVYALVSKQDSLEDKILDLKEEKEKLDIEVGFKKQVIEKYNALIPSQA